MLFRSLEAIVWQTGDILLDEWEESLLIIVTYEIEGEVLRSEEQRLNSSHLGISYAVFCLKKKFF